MASSTEITVALISIVSNIYATVRLSHMFTTKACPVFMTCVDAAVLFALVFWQFASSSSLSSEKE